MKRFFNGLFDYNFYCNKTIIEQCTGMESLPGATAALFNHILNTHHIWNHRLLGQAPEFSAGDTHSKNDWADLHYENQRASFEITSNTEDFGKRLDYENTEGRLYTNTVQDMLFHIINHASQHRGRLPPSSRKPIYPSSYWIIPFTNVDYVFDHPNPIMCNDVP